MNGSCHCGRKVFCVCKCSNVYLCQTHQVQHCLLPGKHETILVKIPLEDSIRESAHAEVLKRLEIVSKLKVNTVEYTKKLLDDIKALNEKRLTRVNEQRKRYIELLMLTRKADVTTEELENIETFINTACECDFNLPEELNQSIKDFYEQDPLKEKKIEAKKLSPEQGIQKIRKMYNMGAGENCNVVSNMAISEDSNILFLVHLIKLCECGI